MSRICRVLSILSLLLLPVMAWADLAPPPAKTVNEGKARLNIVIDEKAKEPTLVIPQKMLADWNKASKEEEQSGLGISPLHTAFAGLAMAGAFAFGGLWLVRFRGHFAGRGLAVLVGTVVLLGVCATAVLADRAPPGKPRNRPGVEGIYLGEAKVRIVDNGDRIKLIINKEDLAKLTAKPEKKE